MLQTAAKQPMASGEAMRDLEIPRQVWRPGPAGSVLSFLLLCVAASAQTMNLMVPMRDGVKLHTLVYLPEGQGPWPVVLTRTPYELARSADARQYTGNGYARVLQNVRGQFKSEGKYGSFPDDINDGYDTVEWAAKQTWSTGKIGMIGGSAPGIAANMAALSGAPHLAAAVVTVATGSGYRHAQYPGGIFLKQMNELWMKGRGIEPSAAPRPLFRTYDEEARRTDMRNSYSKIAVPTINIGGWYDIFGQGNIDNFVGLQSQGAGNAKGHQRLVMGAFGHGELSGEITYPKEASDRHGQDAFRWFDYWLKGIDNGIAKEAPVRYYLMGDTRDKSAPGNEWRSSATWPVKSTATPYYLHGGGKILLTAPTAAEKDTFAYDPRNPIPTVGGNNLNLPKGPMDQRKVSARPDVLKYETAPLSAAVEVAGQIFAELFVSTDAEDTDFLVKLVDVYPDGYEALLVDQGIRLRYHQGLEKESRVEKNKTYAVKVDLWSTAVVFNKGHKIAVHISSSNAPRFEPHSNTWNPVKSYDQAVIANNTVHRAPRQASRILLPVTKIYDSRPSN
ncbi:MAG: CocE/NonD family hydrolase [Candidatus Solibacter usitatus]|nr:CocE/NonD family hydrolase [Candidatus Solibacter usitatus]